MITVNIEKAKAIAHDMRRAARDAEFAPLDKLATVPSMIDEVEAKRQEVRDKYAELQSKIDKAKTLDELKAAIQ